MRHICFIISLVACPLSASAITYYNCLWLIMRMRAKRQCDLHKHFIVKLIKILWIERGHNADIGNRIYRSATSVTSTAISYWCLLQVQKIVACFGFLLSAGCADKCYMFFRSFRIDFWVFDLNFGFLDFSK